MTNDVAALGRKVGPRRLSPEDIYHLWADGRHR